MTAVGVYRSPDLGSGCPGNATMLAITNAAFGVSSSSSLVQFIAFLLMGAFVGWLFNDPRHGAPCCLALAIVGVCGAWLGGEIACLLGRVDRGGWDDFAAAMAGAAALAYLWRRHHPPEIALDGDIAARRSHA
jgi:uncharacterized membrane protein YeaQ/YmgE (transglycosylase-associated protein family)